MKIPQTAEVRVLEYITRYELFSFTGKLYVGFSGGADSTALLLLLKKLCHKKIFAVHFQHGIRKKSADRDAKWCKNFCQQHNIDFTLHYLHVPERMKVGENLEAAARRMRLEYWQNIMGSDDVLALGHHNGDCLEELIIRLTRGANTSGITSLRAKRKIYNITIVRPMLSLSRMQIVEYLQQNNIIEWCEDPTNEKCDLLRNTIRHQWLPAVKEKVGHLRGIQSSLKALNDDADFLEKSALDWFMAMKNICQLRDVHPALFPRILRLWLGEQLGYDLIVSGKTLFRLQNELKKQRTEMVEIPLNDNISLLYQNNCLQLKKADLPELEKVSWNWQEQATLTLADGSKLQADLLQSATGLEGEGEFVELFDLMQMPATIMVRAKEDGDMLIPFAKKSPQKLKKIFSNAKIVSCKQKQYPVIIVNGNIVWLVPLRRAEFARSKPNEPCLRIRYIPSSIG